MLPSGKRCRLALVAALAFAGTATAAERRNVLFIAVDDLNHWVGCYRRNPQTITPHLDRLAGKGVWFTRGYCAAPSCNPSRAALMSGLRPSTTGVYENRDDWRGVIDRDKTLTTCFRRAGYYVAGAGKIYHGAYPRTDEWDDYLESEGKDPAPKGDPGVGGIRFAPLDCQDEDLRDGRIVQYGIDQLQRKHDQPFLLTIGLHKPHMPWNVPRKYYDMHPLDQIELPKVLDDDLDDVPAAGRAMAKPEGDHRRILQSGRWKDAVQGYLAAITYADAMIGRLLDALENSPYRDNTIVVLWGDHGWHLGEKRHWRKFALWEEATRCPYLWVVPGLTPKNQVCERTVDLMSLYPTLTELCGIETPKHVEGKSIRALLADPDAAWDRPALTTHGRGNHALRTERWRYIRYADGSEELYDEAADPYEWTNLAARPEHSLERSRFRQLLPETDSPAVPRGKRKPSRP